MPPPLGDVLALSLCARAMGEKFLKGRDIEGIPTGQWMRGFRGNVSDSVEFVVDGGEDGEFFIVHVRSHVKICC